MTTIQQFGKRVRCSGRNTLTLKLLKATDLTACQAGSHDSRLAAATRREGRPDLAMTPISALVLSDGTLVLRPMGPVTINAESDAGLIAAFDEAIANGQLRIVLDLSETTQMDSAGLAALVRGWIRVKRLRGDMALAGPAPSIKTMLTITRLITIFKVSDTVDESLELLLP